MVYAGIDLILFDNQIFHLQKYGGISRVFSEILQYLHEKSINFELPIFDSENEVLLKMSFYKNIKNDSTFNSILKIISNKISFSKKIKYNIESLIAKKIQKDKIYFIKKYEEQIISKILSNKFSIFHPTYFDDYYIKSISRSKTKLVLTVYDLIHEIYMGYFNQNELVLKNRYSLLKNSEKIIAISENTKNDIVKIYNVPEEKIEVIYLSHNLPTVYKLNTPLYVKDYILFVGNRWIYKNFINMIKAVAPILIRYNIFLLAVGSEPFSKEENLLFDELNIRGKLVHLSFDSDIELANYYKNAIAFVYPSLYEGFGIPLLESMSQGCPVICSNTSSFPEVAGDAAYYFDPWNIESIRFSIEKVITSESIKSDLKLRGFERVKKFSWKKCGEQHIELYNRMI